MSRNLDGMSPRELAALIKQAEARLAVSHAQHIDATRKKIEALLKAADLKLEDVFPRSTRGIARRAGAGVPKIRNPLDPSQTWTGFGKKPAWFVAALKRPGVTEATLRMSSGAIRKPADAAKSLKRGKAPAKRVRRQRKA